MNERQHHRLRARARAAFVHFVFSALVCALIWLVFSQIWYPAPLLVGMGASSIYLLLIAVDVIVGPFLTFVVFDTGKKSLKLDLSVIVVMQIAALAYGMMAMYAARPAYIAYLGKRFDVIRANDIDAIDLAKSGSRLPAWGPEWVGTTVASDKVERDRILLSAALAGVDYGHYPQYHTPLSLSATEMLRNAKPVSDLRARNPALNNKISDWMHAYGRSDENSRYLPLTARSAEYVVVIDATDATVVGVAPFPP